MQLSLPQLLPVRPYIALGVSLHYSILSPYVSVDFLDPLAVNVRSRDSVNAVSKRWMNLQ